MFFGSVFPATFVGNGLFFTTNQQFFTNQRFFTDQRFFTNH